VPAPAPVDPDLVTVTAPLIGTFYRAASPQSRPFVEVGSVVQTGSVLCIIEAMKLMNEIECEAAGTVVEVLVENGRAVEFGEALFRLRPSR
jgi:acetyl-CoA carboxylase biotin carboxyl carrier protein